MAAAVGAIAGCLVLDLALWFVDRRQQRGGRPLRPIAGITFALGGFMAGALGFGGASWSPWWMTALVTAMLMAGGWLMGRRIANRVYDDREEVARRNDSHAMKQ
jgi:drug/metabolite transporter (DMT)-like permease